MAFRLLLPLALLAGLVLAQPAQAKYRVGLGEQNAAMFDQKRWQDLKLKRVRFIVPWDWYKHGYEVAAISNYMTKARQHKQDVLVAFTASRGCYNGRSYRKRKKSCKAPTARQYRSAFRRFDNRYKWVKTYSAWNEVNHVSQPTYRKPSLAVRYYDVLRRERTRRRFKVMAADVLDISNMERYLRAFMKKAKGSPRLWGLHNYGDVNRKRTKYTVQMLDTVPGSVWLTETGGQVRFAGVKKFRRYNEARARSATNWMFKIANRYDSRRRGLRSRIDRLYVYKWFGEPRGARFDAGLVDPDGSPRKAFSVFRKYARRHR